MASSVRDAHDTHSVQSRSAAGKKAAADAASTPADLATLARGLDQLAQKMATGAGNSAEGHAQLVAEVSALRDQANAALQVKTAPDDTV